MPIPLALSTSKVVCWPCLEACDDLCRVTNYSHPLHVFSSFLPEFTQLYGKAKAGKLRVFGLTNLANVGSAFLGKISSALSGRRQSELEDGAKKDVPLSQFRKSKKLATLKELWQTDNGTEESEPDEQEFLRRRFDEYDKDWSGEIDRQGYAFEAPLVLSIACVRS